MSTIFKKIIDKEMAADILYEDENYLAFKDINPKAPVHFLVIPKKEIASLLDLKTADALLMGNLLLIATRVAKEQGLADKGYRFVINCRENGGQTVDHLHLHVLGGRSMNWPPG